MSRAPQRTFSFNQHDDERSFAASHPSPPPYSGFASASPSVISMNVSAKPSAPPAPPHQHNPTSTYQLPPLNTRTDENLNRTASTTTPGADNLGNSAAGGGIAGVALGVAHQYKRESGAIRETGRAQEREYGVGTDSPYVPDPSSQMALDPSFSGRGSAPGRHHARDPFASPTPSPRRSNPFDDVRTNSSQSPSRLTPTNIPMNDYVPRDAFANNRSYSDNPYNRYSSAWDARVSRADIDPEEIDDDGEDFVNNRARSSLPVAAGAGGSAASAGVFGTLGNLVGRNVGPGGGVRDASGQYGPVGQPVHGPGSEKSEWLNSQNSGRKRLRWVVGIIIALVVIGAIVGGVIGGLRAARSRDSSTATSDPLSADEDNKGGDLDKNSPEIKKLLNNPDFKQFRKVFPGVDYTPFNGQYPECLSNPLSQNNVTKDVAVLSQMTNTIRLYGTDCNQTEMVLHAADKLELSGFKVWLGVWLDGNQTTNDRGIDAMHDILSKHGAEPFAGVVVGNEVLFRQELTELQLGEILSDAKEYLSNNKLDIPLATSDLGDAWTESLASKVDVVMANVHPFFGGVTVDKAADWTYNFWQTHNVPLTQNTAKKNMVSEVGWPSAGGTHCGQQTTCTEGSTAGIDEMNKFMDTWICQSKANGTEYFWFEAFDEPWKKKFNEPGKQWEDKWGLMDSGRKLKPGLKIPSCE